MIATSLLEAAVAAALAASLMASLTATVTVAAALSTQAAGIHARLARLHTVEHLLDRAFAHPGAAGPTGSLIAIAEPDRVVLVSDRDGDLVVDSHSAERTAFAVGRTGDGRTRLIHRLGRQGMGICDLTPGARIEYFDTFGTPALSADVARLLRLPTAEGPLDAAVPLPPP